MASSRTCRDYNGFNLIFGDGESLAYFGSREGEAREIAPGVHGLSNHLLDEPWPKVTRGRDAWKRRSAKRFRAGLFGSSPIPPGLPTSACRAPASGSNGSGGSLSPSSPARTTETRASTVLTFPTRGEVSFDEWTRAPDGGVCGKAGDRSSRCAPPESPLAPSLHRPGTGDERDRPVEREGQGIAQALAKPRARFFRDDMQ
jgi:hypothetical protein